MSITFKKLIATVFAVASASLLAPTVASAHRHHHHHGHFYREYHWHHHHRHHGPRIIYGVPGLQYYGGGYRVRLHNDRCSERRALEKAEAYGLRYPHIIEYGRSIVVEGARFSTRARIVLDNRAGCPVAYY